MRAPPWLRVVLKKTARAPNEDRYHLSHHSTYPATPALVRRTPSIRWVHGRSGPFSREPLPVARGAPRHHHRRQLRVGGGGLPIGVAQPAPLVRGTSSSVDPIGIEPTASAMPWLGSAGALGERRLRGPDRDRTDCLRHALVGISRGARRAPPPWTRSGSNRLPPPCHGGALPSELRALQRPKG